MAPGVAGLMQRELAGAGPDGPRSQRIGAKAQEVRLISPQAPQPSTDVQGALRRPPCYGGGAWNSCLDADGSAEKP